jgi:L-alanine-DL-glutamate epimerase-like enolase superfamily enzyme
VKITARIERVTMKRPIVVSRGSYPDHEIVVVEVADSEGRVGVGECCPIAHYGESGAKVCADLAALSLPDSLSREHLLDLLPPGPARNGLDCALWDLEAKRTGSSVWRLAGIAAPERQATALTLMMAPPEDMAAQARDAAGFHTLKLKLGPDDPGRAIAAVRQARPDATLAVDANEGWTMPQLRSLLPVLRSHGVVMVEQPLPASDDTELDRDDFSVALCADESFHSSADLARVARGYAYVNIKLDKCGGLTEALRIVEACRNHSLKAMVGCMFATSLATAPALVVAARCDFADLDGALLIANDRPGALALDGDAYVPKSSSLWGGLDRG